MRFLTILIWNERFDIIDQVDRIFDMLYCKHNNLQRVRITSAVELNDEQINRIEKSLGNKFNKKIDALYEVNSNIIAGLVITTDRIQIDASVKNKLNQLYHYLRDAYYEK